MKAIFLKDKQDKQDTVDNKEVNPKKLQDIHKTLQDKTDKFLNPQDNIRQK